MSNMSPLVLVGVVGILFVLVLAAINVIGNLAG